ncbi:site-specific integrase [Vibrio sp. MA40-2]|uniref:site-specific integrase n=1 Tax=Vibrio sp. MA40-2 TaxID=3391828 RepID=UPI0039A419C8
MYRRFDTTVNKHHIYVDGSQNPLVLPCLFSRYTELQGIKVEIKSYKNRDTNQKEDEFKHTEIGSDASYKICNHLGRFLEWVDSYDESYYVKLSTHTALPQEIINEYINDYLIVECRSSEHVARQAVNALCAYYNWLMYFFDNKYKAIYIKSTHREIARNNNRQEKAVKYLLPQNRQLFYQNTDSLLEELVLRCGGELGLRTKENQGLLLNDYKANTKVHKGLLNLFNDLDLHPNKEEFEYHLSSLYTKYSRSRTLYIPRYLLEKIKLYYDTERPQSDSNHLFVSSSSNNSFGQCISKRFGTDTFAKIRNRLLKEMDDHPERFEGYQEIQLVHVYHHLRHSFGTDIFYNLCRSENKSYESITTTSSVYLTTAVRLGHKVDARSANDVTKEYIHSCGLREKLLRESANE